MSGPQLARLLVDVPVGRPYYTALARAVRALILDGRVPVRVRLPAERHLAAALGVSRTTVTAAYDVLRDEGFLDSRQGAGSWTALPRTGGPHTTQPGNAGLSPFGGPGQEQIIDLGCAAPAAPTIMPDAVAAAVDELSRHTSGSGYEPAGLASLREEIAARYTARGLPTRPDQIVVTGGAQHGLALLLQALVDPGDGVLVERPTYPHALDALRRRGARLVPVGVNEGWDVDLIEAAFRQAAVRFAYLIPDFHNPTGHLMGDADRATLIGAAARADVLVIADETFTELPIDAGAVARPIGSFDQGNRLISIGSAAKLMWGGLRIGWIRATPPMARRLILAREAFDIASPVLEQLIVRELLVRVEEVRSQRARELAERRDVLIAALRTELPSWSVASPPGGMSLWARLPAPVAGALCEAAARYGVRVVPGSVFAVDGVLEDRVRLPFVLPPQTLRAAVGGLARAYGEVEAAPLPGPPPAYV